MRKREREREKKDGHIYIGIIPGIARKYEALQKDKKREKRERERKKTDISIYVYIYREKKPIHN